MKEMIHLFGWVLELDEFLNDTNVLLGLMFLLDLFIKFP